MAFGTIEQALDDLRAGKFIVVADDEDRENEGDLICAAEKITPEMINVMMEAKGMICLAITNEHADRLELPLMGEENTEAMRTAFTVTIDGAPRHGVTTGISAADQATTIRVAVDPSSTASDLRRPGHARARALRQRALQIVALERRQRCIPRHGQQALTCPQVAGFGLRGAARLQALAEGSERGAIVHLATALSIRPVVVRNRAWQTEPKLRWSNAPVA